LAELFDLQGQGAYHAYEAEALEALLAEGQRVVIATGGSIVSAEATYDRLRETCNTLWLRALPEDHLERVVGQGDQRPMRGHPRALEEMRAILADRDPLYQLCDHTIDTSSASLDEVVEQSLVWFQAQMGMGERAQRVEPGK
jgi:XRE family aerobic/anaerobic benzoate catabolism transcriptional regulator